jgi:uncharacterized protein
VAKVCGYENLLHEDTEMRLSACATVLGTLVYLVGCAATSQQTPVAADSVPAFESPVSFLSEGDTLRGTMYVAEGAGPHPTVLFFNGFEGFPEAPDFLSPVHEAGVNVLFFTYGGTWGSDGIFSIERVLADAQAALAFLRSPQTQATYRIDGTSVALYGLSFGGWAALSLASTDSSLNCVAARVPANLGALGRFLETSEPFRTAWIQNLRRLEADDSPVRVEARIEEVVAPLLERAGDFDAVALVPALQDRTVILFGAEQDEQTPIPLHFQPLVDALRETGMEQLTVLTAPGGHQDFRPEWDAAFIEWLREDCFGER